MREKLTGFLIDTHRNTTQDFPRKTAGAGLVLCFYYINKIKNNQKQVIDIFKKGMSYVCNNQ